MRIALTLFFALFLIAGLLYLVLSIPICTKNHTETYSYGDFDSYYYDSQYDIKMPVYIPPLEMERTICEEYVSLSAI
jgi:hypothetical protein